MKELYLVVVSLVLFSGWRILEILLLPRNCRRRPTEVEQVEPGPGIWAIHHNTKTGPRHAEAFIPEVGAELVEDAVDQAQRLTRPA